MTKEEASKVVDKSIPALEQHEEASSSDTKYTNKQSLMAYLIIGTARWFKLQHGYYFIIRTDTHEGIFVHRT